MIEFTLGVMYASFLECWVHAVAFFLLHNYGHRNKVYAKKYQYLHWKHHMKNPNSNWNVVFPLADWIMRTNK